MQDDPTDRGQAQRRSDVTLSSSQPLPDWWTLLTAEIERLGRLLPPKGHTAEQMAARAKAGGKYLAERYRNRPDVVAILSSVITSGLTEWTEFPAPAELVAKIDARLIWDSGAAERAEMAERIRLTKLRDERELEAKSLELKRKWETDAPFRAQHEAYMARVRSEKPKPRISNGPWSEDQTPEQRRTERQQVQAAGKLFREKFDSWKPPEPQTP